MIRKEFTADAAAGSLEDVVALPWLLHLAPGHPHSSAVVTHRQHQPEQSWRLRLRSRSKFSRPPPLLLSYSYPLTSTKNPLELPLGKHRVGVEDILLMKNYFREEGQTASPSLYVGPDTTVCAASGKAALSKEELRRRNLDPRLRTT